jgi:hypothetical protein
MQNLKRPIVFGESTLGNQNVAATQGKPAFDSPLAKPKTKESQSADLNAWLKLSTDNKINVKNSWDIGLIDSFYDMNLLKEGDSINFQRASCTLDGCVNIYTKRIDSVDSDTKRLYTSVVDNKDGGDIIGGEEETLKKAKKVRRCVHQQDIRSILLETLWRRKLPP